MLLVLVRFRLAQPANFTQNIFHSIANATPYIYIVGGAVESVMVGL